MNRLIARALIALAALWSVAVPAAASEGGMVWDKFPQEKMTDMAALQRGAKLFVNYCLNCHAAAFMRYNRLREIGLDENQIKKNLIFSGGKVGDQMTIAMNPREAKEWFGATPPDLTLVARSRAGAGGSGADYLYTYLRTYYRDDTKATGWNNLAFPSVGMPNVLWQLQGERSARFVEKADPHDANKKVHEFEGFEQLTPGTMSSLEYDSAVGDLVAFLQWMAEPMQGQRVKLGAWVLLFIALFMVIAWRLNAAFWKDVK